MNNEIIKNGFDKVNQGLSELKQDIKGTKDFLIEHEVKEGGWFKEIREDNQKFKKDIQEIRIKAERHDYAIYFILVVLFIICIYLWIY